MSKAYAGIGSRKTPEEVQHIMTNFATLCESLGWTLRSGGADSADKAFEAGVINPYNKEIFLPWGGFNGSKSLLTHPSQEAMNMAREVMGDGHWANLSPGMRKLHGRNAHQIMGKSLNDPVKFVLCYTENGLVKGGTATAIKLALRNQIPVFNMGGEVDEAELERIIYQK